MTMAIDASRTASPPFNLLSLPHLLVHNLRLLIERSLGCGKWHRTGVNKGVNKGVHSQGATAGVNASVNTATKGGWSKNDGAVRRVDLASTLRSQTGEKV